MLKLYGYWRSSAAFRLRIALNLKGLSYENISVNIAPSAGEQKGAAYASKNPQMRVPMLETEEGAAAQSMAIFEWLEETYPETPLLPQAPWDRLKARSFADVIACDVHPLNNLSVLTTLRTDFGADDEAVKTWYHNWIARGFKALEIMSGPLLETSGGPFQFGTTPGIAEFTLIPQIWNARRFDMDLTPYPNLVKVDAACLELDAFKDALPSNQPDAPTG